MHKLQVFLHTEVQSESVKAWILCPRKPNSGACMVLLCLSVLSVEGMGLLFSTSAAFATEIFLQALEHVFANSKIS